MKPQKTKREEILDKINNRLKKIEKDPDILDYNYYNDKNFVGVKMTKKTTGVTLNGLAKTVNQLSTTVNQLSKDLATLTKIVVEGFATTNKRLDRLEDFAVKQLAFNEAQLAFNKKIESLPTISKELKELEEKDKK